MVVIDMNDEDDCMLLNILTDFQLYIIRFEWTYCFLASGVLCALKLAWCQVMETRVVEAALVKIVSLAMVALGDAGMDILSVNLKGGSELNRKPKTVLFECNL